MELAGVLIKENTAADVIAAIAKNKAALTAAISKRLKNDEDTSAYEAVESLIIKTAIEAGVPKKYAEDAPWMETYAVPGESTVKSDLEGLEGELIDMIDNPNPEVTATQTMPARISADGLRDAFEKAASQGVYLLGRDAYNDTFEDRMRSRNKQAEIMGWAYCHPVIVKDGSNVYLMFLASPKSMTSSKDPSGVVGIVQVKSSKFAQDIYVDQQTIDSKSDPLSLDKEAIKIKDRLFAKVAQAGFGDKKVRDGFATQTSINPALNGKVKVPECSQIQSELSTVSESLHEQLSRAIKNKL